jgi:hypothetical protein
LKLTNKSVEVDPETENHGVNRSLARLVRDKAIEDLGQNFCSLRKVVPVAAGEHRRDSTGFFDRERRYTSLSKRGVVEEY